MMNGQGMATTQRGMMYGVIAGAMIGAVLFALTGQATWLALGGVGVALGLGIGANFDQRGE